MGGLIMRLICVAAVGVCAVVTAAVAVAGEGFPIIDAINQAVQTNQASARQQQIGAQRRRNSVKIRALCCPRFGWGPERAVNGGIFAIPVERRKASIRFQAITPGTTPTTRRSSFGNWFLMGLRRSMKS